MYRVSDLFILEHLQENIFHKGDISSETASCRNAVSSYISKGKQANQVICIGSFFPQANAVFCDPKWSQLALEF